MRRLEYARRARSVRSHAKNGTEAVTLLAQFARERQRLEQERKSLEDRLRRIDARLTMIAGNETRLYPAAKPAPQVERLAGPPPGRVIPVRPAAPPRGVTEVTLQY